MGTGHSIRMRRVFRRDARTVIVALDHLAVLTEPVPSLGDTLNLVRAIRRGGADAVLITRGALNHAPDYPDGLTAILSVPLDAGAARHVPELALRAGADMVKVVLYPFTPGFEQASGWLAALTAACERWNLPVLVETVPGGFHAEAAMREADALSAAARIAVELGASAIKTFLPQLHGEARPTGDDRVADVDLEGLRRLCDYVPVPVVVLGGDPVDLGTLTERIAAAIAAGAAGAAVGRNVWGNPVPCDVVSALARAVHGSIDPSASNA